MKRWNTANKDDDRKTLNRESSWSTKKSAPESESSVIGAVITNSFFFQVIHVVGLMKVRRQKLLPV